MIRELANGREVEYRGSTIRFPWAAKSRVEVWMAGYGPEGAAADRRARRRVHPAARRPRHRGVDDRRRAPGAPRRPGAIPTRSRSASRRRPTWATTSRTRATSAAGSAAWSATTSPTSSRATARPRDVPAALTDYIAGREGYDYNEHGQAGNVAHRVRARRDRRPLLPAGTGRRARARACRSCRRWASTSSRSTCSTTPRTRRCRPTASRCSRRSPSTSPRRPEPDRAEEDRRRASSGAFRSWAHRRSSVRIGLLPARTSSVVPPPRQWVSSTLLSVCRRMNLSTRAATMTVQSPSHGDELRDEIDG